MQISNKQINKMEEYLSINYSDLVEYAKGFIRLYRIEENFKLKDMYKRDLKNLYKIKRLVKESELWFNKDFFGELDRSIDKNIEALTTLAYIKNKDWDKVGICGNCFGNLFVGSQDIMAHCGDMDTCECYYHYIEGFQLKKSIFGKRIGSKYEYKLAKTQIMLDILKGYKD